MNLSFIHKQFSRYVYIFLFGIINSVILCLSANNFLSFVIGLELYAFSTCFLLIASSKNRESKKSAIRFLLTSFAATAILLYGISVYYSYSGSLSFSQIQIDESFSAIVGSMLIVSALLFKLGAAPFHSWIIDIYETAPYGLVMFFDAIWKLCIFFIFTKFFKLLFGSNHFQIQLFLELISIISMIIGSIMPIFQKSIKKFVAYSSIGHTGFAISVYAISNNLSTLRNAIMYIIAHCIASTCFFATLLEISKHRKIETFDDITGLFKDSPMMGCCMLSSMFALIGIPPFINFITKLQILKAQILHERYVILSVSIMYSVLGILYTVNATTKIFNRDETHNNNVSDLPRNSLAISLSFFILMSSPIFYIMASDWIEYILNQI